MAEAFLGHLGVHAGEQELGRMAMAQIMEPDPRDVFHAAGESREFMRKASRLHRFPIGASA